MWRVCSVAVFFELRASDPLTIFSFATTVSATFSVCSRACLPCSCTRSRCISLFWTSCCSVCIGHFACSGWFPPCPCPSISPTVTGAIAVTGAGTFFAPAAPANRPMISKLRSRGMRIPSVGSQSAFLEILFSQEMVPRSAVISHNSSSPLSRCRYSSIISLPDTIPCPLSCTIRISSFSQLSSFAYPAPRIRCPFSCNSK